MFEEVCQTILEEIEQPLTEALDSAGIEATELEDVILIGGSSRMPIVQQKLSEFLGIEIMSKKFNPDE